MKSGMKRGMKSGMKSVMTTLLVFGVVAANVASAADVIRLSEPHSSDATTETFGGALSQDIPVRSLSEIMAEPAAYVGRDLQVQTRIAQVCQKKGCFFIATEGAHSVRVAFKDYAFFVPTDSAGKTVTLEGQLVRKSLSPEQAEHFSSDLGSEAAVQPGAVYELLASAVRVPRSAPST